MTKLKGIVPLLSILLSIVNLGLFYFWYRVAESKCGFSMPRECGDAISIQFGIMNIMLVCVTIFLVVIGFLGYAGIKGHAKDIAQKTAKDTADSYIRELKRQEEAKKRQDTKTTPSQEVLVKDDQIKPEELNL